MVRRRSWLAGIACVAMSQVVRPAGGAEATVRVPGPDGPLSGTMMSAGPPDAPIVLIVPGSGPVDQDGNGPGGLRAATYRLLAEGLAAQGIATVRIDKRGMFASRTAVPDADAVTIEDYAADVSAWIDVIRAQVPTPCVWLLGHSEGGLVALLAGQSPRDICGFILVATAGRPLGEVLREQLRSNSANAPILSEAQSILAQLEAGRRVDAESMAPALSPLFRPSVQDFLISELSLDPAALIARLKQSILIVQGARDVQIQVSDAERLKAASPAANLTVVPDTNHVLKRVVVDRFAENIATYADPTLPLAPGVVEAITGFVKAHAREVR